MSGIILEARSKYEWMDRWNMDGCVTVTNRQSDQMENEQMNGYCCHPIIFNVSLVMLSVIDKLGAKELVMNLVNDRNTEVRMQALLSIQKMMVQNW